MGRIHMPQARKTISKVCFIALLLSITTLAKAQDIIGIWLTTGGVSKIQIYKTSKGTFEGKLIWTKEQSEKAKKFHGSLILYDVKKTEVNEYEGHAYDPKEKKAYDCNITLKNKNELDLRGYIGIPLFGRTEHWKRVDN